MKSLFDHVSAKCSKITTHAYSTSFSLGIYFLDKKLHEPIHSIYGFVRLADEIVDSFHEFDKITLLTEFKTETFKAINNGISLNPILNAFQKTVTRYRIDHSLIGTFLKSMEMDLTEKTHDRTSYQEYILGSAEVVGLMCLTVFCNGDAEQYNLLKDSAQRLGAAFQKVNFLRDLANDYEDLQRSYFPSVDISKLTAKEKRLIEHEIREDFQAAWNGILRLPKDARFGVYVAYVYYRALFRKIEKTPREKLLQQRLRVPNYQKFGLLINSYFRYNFNLLRGDA